MKRRKERYWPQIHERDWNFSIPDHLLEFCLGWEIEREKAVRGLPILRFPPDSNRYSEAVRPTVLAGKALEDCKRPFPRSAPDMQVALWEPWTYDPAVHEPCGPHESILPSLKIDWNISPAYWRKVFESWLLANQPKGRSTPAISTPVGNRKAGAGNPIRQAKKHLKHLGAARLIDYYKGNWERAKQHPGALKVLGKNCERQSFWSEAKTATQQLLQQFGSK